MTKLLTIGRFFLLGVALLSFSAYAHKSVVSLPTNIKQEQKVSLADLEKLVNLQVNEYRKKQNLPPLTLDPSISNQARLHSQDMADAKVPFSHQGFDKRAEAIALSIPYSSVAENVAYNQGYKDPVSVSVEGWIKSPGHRKNMEGNFNLTGVGIAVNNKGEYYFTQIFVLKR